MCVLCMLRRVEREFVLECGEDTIRFNRGNSLVMNDTVISPTVNNLPHSVLIN